VITEAVWLESGCDGLVLHHRIVGGFGPGRRDVAEGLEQPTIAVPVDPFERWILDGVKRLPRTFAPNHLGFVRAVDRLSERFVTTFAGAAGERFKTSFAEALGILDGQALFSRLGRCFPGERFLGPGIERIRYGGDRVGILNAEIRPFREVLA
jgi:hypothetical protein